MKKIREEKIIDKIYKSVIEYIEFYNGKVLVIGGIALVDEGMRNKYGVMIRILGKKPIFRKDI